MCDAITKFINHSKFNFDNSDDLAINKMIHALSGIASEMQRFHTTTPVAYHIVGDRQELDEKLSLCKSNLKLKRKQIKLLKEKLRKASIVAKIIMSAKESQKISLHNHINRAKSQCADLNLMFDANTKVTQNVKSENQALQDKIENLENFIVLGYQQLQKMRSVRAEKIPTVMMLKEIMLSCGQYYADYSNEHDTRKQLEQKNRFLNNKMNFIVNNLEAVTEELENMRYINARLRNENNLLKNNKVKFGNSSEEKPISELLLEREQNINMLTAVSSRSVHHTLVLSSHLSLVKNLLTNQDAMLQDLKKLSAELNDISCFTESFDS